MVGSEAVSGYSKTVHTVLEQKRELNYATPYALGPQVPPEVCPGNALKVALDHLQQTYGLTTANKFGPLTLAAIQDRLIAQ